eukprot:11505681-Ditylum_brightwellii.AAC.2
MQQKTSDQEDASTMFKLPTPTPIRMDQCHLGWIGYHLALIYHPCFIQMGNICKYILLDSDSIDSIFCNREYVRSIRPAQKALTLNTDGGDMTSNMI